ncbi:MAG: electron transfer flavoprotein subunit beta/FixA family protein [archaeon]
MNIIVPIKQVPETSNVKMDPVTGTMVRDGVEPIINPLDLYAIEAAVRIRETQGGMTTALSMGPPKADLAIKEAVAMGCDTGVLLSNKAFAGADTWATSYVISQAIRKIGNFDLILCGERATDGDTGQVGPGIAAWLDIPFATYISAIVEIRPESLVVERMVESGYETLEIALPCLLTVVKELNYPRLPSLRGKLNAKKMELKVWGPAEIDALTENIGLQGSPTRVVKISSPQVARNGEVIQPKDEREIETAVDGLIHFLQSKEII